MKSQQWFRRVSDEWQNLPASEKQKYFDKENELYETYQRNMQNWIIEVLSHKDEKYNPLKAVLFKKLQTVSYTYLNTVIVLCILVFW